MGGASQLARMGKWEDVKGLIGVRGGGACGTLPSSLFELQRTEGRPGPDSSTPLRLILSVFRAPGIPWGQLATHACHCQLGRSPVRSSQNHRAGTPYRGGGGSPSILPSFMTACWETSGGSHSRGVYFWSPGLQGVRGRLPALMAGHSCLLLLVLLF